VCDKIAGRLLLQNESYSWKSAILLGMMSISGYCTQGKWRFVFIINNFLGMLSVRLVLVNRLIFMPCDG